MIFVLFRDGHCGWYVRYDVMGGCKSGDPTVYVYRQSGAAMRRVYVKPGQSVNFVEV
jgi:hypothetical protein